MKRRETRQIPASNAVSSALPSAIDTILTPRPKIPPETIILTDSSFIDINEKAQGRSP
jgi:hypothetical protein